MFEEKDMSKVSKIRAFLDTNILLSSIIVSKGNPSKAISAWKQDLFILLISSESLQELEDVTSRKKFLDKYNSFKQTSSELISMLKLGAEIVAPLPKEDLRVNSRDPKDDYFLASALGSNADYLVTGDEDLLELNDNPNLGNLKILTVKKFIELLKQNQ